MDRMLETVVYWRTGCFFSFATRERLQTAWFLIWWNSFLCMSCLFLIRCAWNFHACLLRLYFLEMRLNTTHRFCMRKISCLTLALTNAVFLLNWTYASMKQHVETFFKLLCWCVILLCDFSLSTDVPKTLQPLSIIFETGKSHTQSIALYSVSVVPKLHCLLLVVSARPWKNLICCCRCFSPFYFPTDRLNFCVWWLPCACMQPIMGVGLNRILLFQMNWPHVTNTNNSTGWLKDLLQMDQRWSEILH